MSISIIYLKIPKIESAPIDTDISHPNRLQHSPYARYNGTVQYQMQLVRRRYRIPAQKPESQVGRIVMSRPELKLAMKMARLSLQVGNRRRLRLVGGMYVVGPIMR
jgi:hypothetical protein